MLLSKLVGVRSKDNPSDAVIKSHLLLMRAGFIKSVANGIWTLAMPAKRIAAKIERIVREEMDGIDGQECLFPVVMPRELWEETGRYSSIGEEMVRLKDRCGRDLVLGMTHEEAAVHLARDFVSSYQQLPFMIYQIQTKFRDEARARGGLIRVREFTMKDAYSFHISQEDLEEYYDRAYEAYNRIFKRIGLNNFVAVKSDSGMMGGDISHEFMLLTDAGEDTVVLCKACGYKANMEVAESAAESFRDAVSETPSEVFTGEATEISEVSEYLKIPAYKTMKAVCFNIKGEKTGVLCFLRGDLEVNEAKLKKVVRKEIVPANLADGKTLVAGNIGPLNLKLDDYIIIYDESLKNENNMVIGANKPEYHIKGIEPARDLDIKEYRDIAKVKAGALCKTCGKPLTLENGIEIGNIFRLGTKYTKSMNMTVLNSEGKSVHPIMGCYGLGVGRAISAVAEENADEKGLKWSMPIAPWHVYLCPIRIDNEQVRIAAYGLYEGMKNAGIEVLFDDRNASPGYKFSDCDLMGLPIRVVISPKTLENREIELRLRDGSLQENIPLNDCIERLKEIITAEGGVLTIVN